MNRLKAKTFPKSVCAVVYQRNRVGCQFSWTCEKTKRGIDPVVYKKAFDMAVDVIQNGLRLNKVQNALYFHSTRVSPRWAKDSDLRVVAQIGAHIFYIPVKGT